MFIDGRRRVRGFYFERFEPLKNRGGIGTTYGMWKRLVRQRVIPATTPLITYSWLRTVPSHKHHHSMIQACPTRNNSRHIAIYFRNYKCLVTSANVLIDTSCAPSFHRHHPVNARSPALGHCITCHLLHSEGWKQSLI